MFFSLIFFSLLSVSFCFLVYTGKTSQTVTVLCDIGYTGSGIVTCGTGGIFSTLTCKANICSCQNGIPTVATGSGGTLCDTETVDCSDCDAAYHISATAVSGSAQTCVANICTCPFGTPTTALGSGGTLCDTETVDCSNCNAGYTISATAISGSAQTCVANTCITTQIPNSNKADKDIISGKSFI